jgi:hypothetical protein
MVLATYAGTIYPGQEPSLQATARVTIETEEATWQAEVGYWPSLVDQWGEEGVHAFVEAEALAAAGCVADAHGHLPLDVPWCDRWRTEHPLP